MSIKEQRERIELHQGWLDLLILRKRLRGLSHGQAIAKTIEFNLGRYIASRARVTLSSAAPSGVGS